MTKELHLDEQPLPHDEGAERTILGAMILEPSALADGVDGLHSEDFFFDSHRRIFLALKSLHNASTPVDFTTLGSYLKARRELDTIGGQAYLFGLTEGLPRRIAVTAWTNIVQDKARKRELLYLAQSISTAAGDDSEPVADILERGLNALREVSEDTQDTAGLTAARDVLGPTVNDAAPLSETFRVRDGIPYGFSKLDELTGGAQKAELIIIAARPSMGKTALLCSITAHQGMTLGRHIAVFTAEQKSVAILRRILSARARVDYQDIRKGTLRAYDRTLLLEHGKLLAAAPIFLDDQPKPTVSRIRARAFRLKRELEREGRTLDGILIDQLSKFSHADLDRRMPRHERVGEITGGLKALAQELDVPIILLVQIGREGGKRADRPQLTDLKDSGNIEEDADVVLFPHRPEYYDKTDTSLAGKAEIIIAKQREGPTDICECAYTARIMRWEDNDDNKPPVAKQDGFTQERW